MGHELNTGQKGVHERVPIVFILQHEGTVELSLELLHVIVTELSALVTHPDDHKFEFVELRNGFCRLNLSVLLVVRVFHII